MSTVFGVAGDMGSFSEEAALLYARQNGISPSLVYLIDMEGVLSALEQGKIALGILPVVNLHGGLVKPAFQAMGKHRFTLVNELWLQIQQCLLVLPKTKRQQITHIASHAQGLAQCKNYLNNEFKETKLIEWCDTAKSAKDLAEGEFPLCTAVIAPERCAALYNLEVMAKNIQDHNPNLTAFIIVEPVL